MPSTATKLPKRLVTLVPRIRGSALATDTNVDATGWRRDRAGPIHAGRPGAVDAVAIVRSGADVGDLATVGPLAQPHDLVHRVEVRARRRLDHVGGDAAAR